MVPVSTGTTKVSVIMTSTDNVVDTTAPAPDRKPRPLALSPSRAGDYQQCPLLYRLRAIDRLPEPKTVAQVKGTLVHAVLEEMHKRTDKEHEHPDTETTTRQWSNASSHTGRTCAPRTRT